MGKKVPFFFFFMTVNAGVCGVVDRARFINQQSTSTILNFGVGANDESSSFLPARGTLITRMRNQIYVYNSSRSIEARACV